jgi:hypothetical protein
MNHSKLLNYLWRAGHFEGVGHDAVTGERVTVVAQGERDESRQGVWMAAEVVVDGERRRGCVAVGEDAAVPDCAVLRVVGEARTPVLGVDNRLVTQIEKTAPVSVSRCYESLRAGAATCDCSERIARMEPLRRTQFYTSMLVERLQRKTQRIMEVFEATERDWNQTFHVLLLGAMGGDRNREAFQTLASKATVVIASREKSSLLRVEALLLGTAGFLFGEGGGPDGDFHEKDFYTLRLEEEARHLFAKYGIVPLKPAVWNLAGLYPANHPAVRLAEIAALFCKKDFMLDAVLECRTSDDVERLFAQRASEYWHTHYKPSGMASTPTTKSIGRAKARLIGINLVAPLMFVYGKQTAAQHLCDRALDLLGSIPAEKNRLLVPWYRGGCTAASGFESQALLQLSTEYCDRGACTDCPVGRAEIKKSLAETVFAINV